MSAHTQINSCIYDMLGPYEIKFINIRYKYLLYTYISMIYVKNVVSLYVVLNHGTDIPFFSDDRN